MSKLHGNKQAQNLEKAILDLIGAFDEELTEAGLSEHAIDAHVAGILIDLLRLIVVERETFSAGSLSRVVKETLHEAQHEH